MNNTQTPLTAVHTANAPAAIGPYSQAVCAGGFVYVSGRSPLTRPPASLPGRTSAPRPAKSLKNIAAILAAAGSGMDRVVKTTVLLKDIGDFAAMNEVYAEAFTAPYPARAAFEPPPCPKARWSRSNVWRRCKYYKLQADPGAFPPRIRVFHVEIVENPVETVERRPFSCAAAAVLRTGRGGVSTSNC